MAGKYFLLAEALYYRILESIIEREKMILGDADLSVSALLLREVLLREVQSKAAWSVCVLQCILEQDVFHRSLLACCLEVVLFSYKPPGDFPNVIDVFQLQAYHFYKVTTTTAQSQRCVFSVKLMCVSVCVPAGD